MAGKPDRRSWHPVVILAGVFRCVRVSSGLVLLLVMLGLPVAPVLCELACPQPVSAVAVPPAPRHVLASASRGAPCHDAGKRDTAHHEANADAAVAVAHAGAMGAAEHHGCDHPAVVTSPRSAESLRLPAPALIATETSQHLSPLTSSSTVVTMLAAARAPARAPASSLSLVLRI